VTPSPLKAGAAATGLVARAREAIRKALPRDSLRARLAKGIFWSSAGSVVSQGLGLLAQIVTARLLGLVSYGELGAILETVGMFGVFAGLGLGMTTMKHLAEFKRADPPKAARIIRLTSMAAVISGVLIAAVMSALAPALSNVFRDPTRPEVKLRMAELQFACVLLLFNTISGSQTGALSGLEAFRTIATVSAIRGLAAFPLTLAGVYFFGLPGAVLAAVAAAALHCAINTLALRKVCLRDGIPLSAKRWWLELPILWKFSLPAFVSSLMFAPVEFYLKVVMVRTPGGMGQMGLFTAARRWQDFILLLPGMLSGVTLPVLASLWSEGKLPQYRKVLVANSLLLTAAALVVAAPIAAASPWIMGVYGKGFVDGATVLLLICVTAVLYAANIVMGQAIWATGSSVTGMVLAAIRAALLVGLFLWFAKWGATGLALAFAITYVAQTIYQTPLVIGAMRKRAANEMRPS
jgi:O-antigen/teichoic acid export membrane protein